jgi:2-polyprenyl-3-methyl-5-hydroxy-6-metoxy-1,4-benzoquinol methylase
MVKNVPYREKEVVKEDFNKLEDYDAKRDMYYFHRRLKRLLKELPLDKKIKILDFGGGSGLFSLELKKRGYTNLHLIDLSPVQVKQALEKGLKNVHCGDEDHAIKTFKKNYFDFIFMCDVIEHLEKPANTLLKIREVLSPNGKLFLTYPNPLWVPVLNVLGNIGLKLKGKDNKIYLLRLMRKLRKSFKLVIYEGHMLISKIPKPLLKIFEGVEEVLPNKLKRRICLLNIAILRKL